MNDCKINRFQFETLIQYLEDIKQKLEAPANRLAGQYLDNADFIQLMKISPRTAQTWRDRGWITFSQIGKKIYYKVEDIKVFLEKHNRRARYL